MPERHCHFLLALSLEVFNGLLIFIHRGHIFQLTLNPVCCINLESAEPKQEAGDTHISLLCSITYTFNLTERKKFLEIKLQDRFTAETFLLRHNKSLLLCLTIL